MSPHRSIAPLVAAALALGAVSPSAALAASSGDPLGEAIHGWQERIRTTTPGDDEAKQARESATLYLGHAERALADGQRWLALSRLALVWNMLEAADYRSAVPGELRTQMAGLEAEWRRLAPELGPEGAVAARPDFAGVPAAARAVGEAAWAEVPVYYAASLDYGENTAPEYGLYYLGAAKAQLDLARLAARLRAPAPAGAALAPRSVAAELEALESELLAAYRPPLSVEAHPVFIRISALVKAARELDAQGLHHGALYKLLDARMRLSRLQHPGRALSADDAQREALRISTELTATHVDASLAELFLETAVFSAADPDPAAGGGEVAAAILADVMPLYNAALGP
ncbi:MAG: hypothetical protein NDJ75_08375, partial [Thermoanaerobaculia bacterium]|nr:hypothetical protein [Thermoanaerobaculia bacterium]